MESRNYINILLQDLTKKDRVLDEIIQANQRQKEALENPNLDPDDFDVIVEQKAKLIEQLNQLDDGFEQVYARVREELLENRESYREEILKMQELIRRLTDKSAVIETGEQRNKALMTQKFAAVKKQVREIRASQKVVNQYYRSMMQKETVEPQFMDNKK